MFKIQSCSCTLSFCGKHSCSSTMRERKNVWCSSLFQVLFHQRRKGNTTKHKILLSSIISNCDSVLTCFDGRITSVFIWSWESDVLSFLKLVNFLLFFLFFRQTFKPLVGKSVYNSVTAVEFLVDKQLDFITEDSAFQPYQVRNLVSVQVLSIQLS